MIDNRCPETGQVVVVDDTHSIFVFFWDFFFAFRKMRSFARKFAQINTLLSSMFLRVAEFIKSKGCD